MRKNIFTIIFTLVVSTGTIFASSIEVNGIWYHFNNDVFGYNNTASVRYQGGQYDSYSNEYSGKVVIPSSVNYNGKTYSVTEIGNEAFRDCTNLTSVTIPNSVISIGNRAFSGCTGLTSVTIPNSVREIGSEAFDGCPGMTSVTIGNSVETIGKWAFEGCTGLTSIIIPNSIISIGEGAFYDVLNIVYSGTASGSPWGAKSINGYLDGLFVYSDDTKTNLLACSSTASGIITIPNSITEIGSSAFRNCTGLTSVTIPNSVTSIGERAFYGCTSLASVTIPESVSSIGTGRTFEGCIALQNVVWNAKKCIIEKDNNGKYHAPFLNLINITSFVFGNEVESITKVLCLGLEGLTSVTIPNTVISIDDEAFFGCTGLTSVTIPNSVTSIGNRAFCKCTSLTSITIPNSVTSIGGYAFSGCTGLTSITIPNSVTSIGERAFYGCNSLPVINNIRYADTYLIEAVDETLSTYSIKDGTKWIGADAFMGCTSMTSINIPSSVISIESTAFQNCTGLTSVTIPNSVKSISDGAFYGCTSLPVTNNIRYADTYLVEAVDKTVSTYSIKDGTKWIGADAFMGCTSMTSINFPGSVISIECYAFEGCTGLTSITIPHSVINIGYYAFSGCSNLYSVTMEALIPPSGVFNPFPLGVIIYIPFGTRYSYLQNGWEEYDLRSIQLLTATIAGVAPTSAVITMGDNETREYIASCGLHGSEDEFPGYVIEWNGLEPESEYANVPLFIKTTAGSYDTIHYSFKTNALELKTQPAHLTSESSAILIANTNMADIETSCGFEFRRTSASEDVPSQIMDCPVANGTMAVKVKNLKAGTEYKYRPFYKSAAEKMYYGDWKAFDPQDAYITYEPIIYTYAASAVKEHEATLNGYALEGSDDFTEQGFEYWADSRIKNNMPGIRYSAQLGDKKTVTATGISMKVTLTNLDQGTVYKYRTFAKMGDQVVYGPEMSFTTQGEWVAFTVTFLDKDGKVIEVQEVEAGTDAIAPQAPEVKGYKFIGWDKDITNVQSDLTVTAQYEKNEENPNEAIENVDANIVTPQKIMHNGVLYILRDGKTYTVQGQEVK